MSGIGEAASIAGLITISGQCVKQIANLYSFARNFQNVLPQTTKLLDELNNMQQCLSQVESVASKALAANNCNVSESVDALFKTVKQCQSAITAMEGDLQAVYTSKKNMLLKRVKITAAKDFFAPFQAQIAAQKQNMLLQLGKLSCDLGLQTHNLGLQTHNSMERLTASSSTMETMLSDMTLNSDRHHDLSKRQLQCLEARLVTLQNMLVQSISANQRSDPKSRTTLAIRTKVRKRRCSKRTFQRAEASKSSETQNSNLQPATQLLRVVSPALLTYEKGGLVQRKVVPLVCSELDGIDDTTKIQMINYLQGLRLLIWLLEQNNPWTTNVSDLGITGRSVSAMQAERELSREVARNLLVGSQLYEKVPLYRLASVVRATMRQIICQPSEARLLSEQRGSEWSLESEIIYTLLSSRVVLRMRQNIFGDLASHFLVSYQWCDFSYLPNS